MARLALGACVGLVVGVLAGAALGLHAQDVDADTSAVASEAGVDPIQLAGAVNSTRLEPRVYLCAADGLLCPPPIPPPPAIGAPWVALAQCESGGNPRTNTGNGYYGMFQEDMAFWRNHGGLQYAARPDLATPAQQLTVAIRGQASQGWGAWPNCSRRVGLR